MQEITLEKIDLIRDRTGVTYREAHEALQRNDGNVISALIELEDSKQSSWKIACGIREKIQPHEER